MANITIEQATVGYDTNGLQEVVNKLNLVIFNGAATKVRDSIVPMHQAVDACWAGQAADSFKAKYERDANTMIDTLNSLEEQVRGQIAQMAENVDKADSAIADRINSME